MLNNKYIDAESIYEKKKWISVTGLCNNNCLFCLDGDRPDKFHKKINEIYKEIDEAKEEGCKKLVLSGGDPTIHPKIIEIVRYAKFIGYKKVQLITNGRLFASKKFTNNIIDAGLDEVTFSLHGYNSEMHDSLTQVPGSFKEIIIGIKNVQNHPKEIIINTDTCITKSNYMFLPNIIRFIVEKIGIMEINLMSMVPQGNAWKNREEIMYDYNVVAPYVYKVIDYCIRKNAVLWLSRFPAKCLEDYEQFIEDPYKMVDEVRGRIDILKNSTTLKCKGEKCEYCSIFSICDDLLKINRYSDNKAKLNTFDKYDMIINLDKNFGSKKRVHNSKQKTLLKLTEPKKRIKEYKKSVPKINNIIYLIKNFDYDNVYIEGVPYCILKNKGIKKINVIKEKNIDYSKFKKGNKKNYLGLAEELAIKSKTKKSSCSYCKYFNSCLGIYTNYVRIYGFKEIEPIK